MDALELLRVDHRRVTTVPDKANHPSALRWSSWKAGGRSGARALGRAQASTAPTNAADGPDQADERERPHSRVVECGRGVGGGVFGCSSVVRSAPVLRPSRVPTGGVPVTRTVRPTRVRAHRPGYPTRRDG